MTVATALAPALSIAMGLAALVEPERFGAQVGLSADGPLGRSELRAVFGGVFVGLGLACLLSGARGAWLAGAGVFAGGVAAKLGSAATETGVLPAAALGLAVDAVLCALFLLGAPA
ncbi:MAG: hypothetical protein ACKOCT_13855 [Alphaproteobacteria bacterium]